MNTKQILASCLSLTALVATSLPAFALKVAPTSGKVPSAQCSKIKCAKMSGKKSAKIKATTLVASKKSK